MSDTIIEYYRLVAQQVCIFLGIPILIMGLIGNIFNLVVFLSLKTFRENACAFYLTVMSAVNVGQLLTGLFTRIMISGFNIDWTLSSVFYCKFRIYCLQSCTLISFLCMCSASINQFCATCTNVRWRNWSNIKIAYRIIVLSTCICLLHGIPYWIYYDHILSKITDKLVCGSRNIILQQYYNNFYIFILTGVLPILINGIFSFLASHKLRQIEWRALPFIQRELDRQLTAIIFIQFIYHTIVTLPYMIYTILTENIELNDDSLVAAKLQIANSIILCIYYLNYALPFYMYICVSPRFRRQFMYTFLETCVNKWQPQILTINQVAPQF